MGLNLQRGLDLAGVLSKIVGHSSIRPEFTLYCFYSKRIESLKAFTEGSADFMLATDLASRGLDIERVKTVSRIPQTIAPLPKKWTK